MNSIDLRQIRYFVAAYEERSFSKAAKREHSTQSGVSVCIQELESSLSHQLFDRTAVGVSPTLAGKHFYECAIEVLKAMKAAQQKMLDISGPLTGVINLGFPPSVFKSAVPILLPNYLAAHPFIDIRLAEAYSGTLTDWVMGGEIDAALVTIPPASLGLETIPFFRDPLVLVTRKGGLPSLNGRSTTSFKASELRNLKLILPSARHSLRRVIEASVQLDSVTSGRILEIDGMLGTLELIQKSDWATIVGKTMVMEEVRAGKLDAYSIAGAKLWHDLFLIQTKETVLSPLCRNFLEHVKTTLEAM